MKRVTRMWIGLVSLIPMLAVVGLLVDAVGLEGVAAAWTLFGVALAWLGLMAWWTVQAPPDLTQEEADRYLAPLRHAKYDEGGAETEEPGR